jgi:hypothetical protein
MNDLQALRNPTPFVWRNKPFETVRLGLLLIFISLIFSVATGEAKAGLPDNTSPSSLPHEDDIISNGVPGKALLSLKTQRNFVSFKEFKLFRSKLNTSQLELMQRGWTNSDETLVWTPGGIDPYIEIPIQWEEGPGISKITSFNYIQFDYQELYPDNPSKLFLEMVLDPDDLAKKDLEQEKIKEDVLLAGGYKALHDFKVEDSQDITASGLTQKDFWYLSKRILRLPFNKNWVFAQSGQTAVFQRRFNKDLKSIESMEIFLSKAIDISKVKLTLRIGRGGLFNKESIVHWDNIPVKEILTVEGRQFIKIGLGDLVRQRYLNKKDITLKEVAVFIPGDSASLALTDPLENIHFLKTKRTYLKEDWQLPALTHTLSKERKRFELNLWGMTNVTGKYPKVKSIRLHISPQNKHAFSGVRFLEARVNQLVHIQQPKFLNAGEHLSKRWGGRFLTHTPGQKFVEWVHIKSYFPFNNLDSEKQYKSGRDQSGDITVRSNKGALYRLDETSNLLAADLQFYSEDASFSIELQPIQTIAKDREVTVEWELEGALQLNLSKRFLHPLNGNITRFRLRKGELPVLKIELADKSLLKKSGRVSGRVVIKSIRARDLSIEEAAENNKLKGGFNDNSDADKLKEEERRSINESKHFPVEGVENSTPKITRLFKSGVVIRAESAINHLRPEPNGFLIQGEGQWMDIDWPVHASLDKDTLFFLGVSGGAESILSLEITPTAKGQKLKTVLGTPNNPFQLIEDTTEIENLQIRMKLRKGSFNISLEEMSLFNPVVVSLKQAFKLPTLVWGETPLTPESTQFDSKTQSIIKPGSLKAIVSSENSRHPKLSWTTKIDRKPSFVRGLKINYQVPSAVHNNNPCWLELTLIGAKSKADQNVCFDSANGQVFLPSGFLFQNFETKLNENLNSIGWSVRLDPRKPIPKIPLSINLEMILDGVEIVSVRKDLKRQPIFEWNGEKVYPSFSGNRLFESLLTNKGWSNFRLFNLYIKSEKSLPTLNEEHPYLQTKTIAFENIDHLLSKKKSRQADEDKEEFIPDESTSPGLFESKLSKLFLALLLIGLAFNKTVRSTLKSFTKFIAPKIFQPHLFLNRTIGFLVIGPGFWASGRIVGQQIEHIWICTLLVLLTGVFYHELRWFLLKNSPASAWTHKIVSGADGELPFFLYFMTTAVFGWSAWQISQYVEGPHPALPLISLISLGYFYIPWIPDLFNRAIAWPTHSRNYSVTTMVGLATALYIFGNLWEWSEIFMSFGGMVLVLLWGHWAQKNQPKIEIHWPGIARQVYAEKGNRYLAGFLLTMGIGAFCLLVGLDALAEHTVNVSFFMLVTALYLNMRSISEQRQNQTTSYKSP